MALEDVQAVIDTFKTNMVSGPGTQTTKYVRPGGWLWNRHPAGHKDLEGELSDLIDELKIAIANAY